MFRKIISQLKNGYYPFNDSIRFCYFYEKRSLVKFVPDKNLERLGYQLYPRHFSQSINESHFERMREILGLGSISQDFPDQKNDKVSRLSFLVQESGSFQTTPNFRVSGNPLRSIPETTWSGNFRFPALALL